MRRGLLRHRPSLAALTMGDYLFSARCWQLHLPKTVQKCNCLVNAGHNSCQRPWKTTIRENTLRKKLFIQFIKGWVAKSYANLDWQSIANLFAAASCRSHTQPFSLDMIMIKRHIVALYLTRLDYYYASLQNELLLTFLHIACFSSTNWLDPTFHLKPNFFKLLVRILIANYISDHVALKFAMFHSTWS